jgi:hypothetical protein
MADGGVWRYKFVVGATVRRASLIWSAIRETPIFS